MQEAAALTELEDRMKMSNRLLARKEVAINQLQASLAQEVTGDVILVAITMHIYVHVCESLRSTSSCEVTDDVD